MKLSIYISLLAVGFIPAVPAAGGPCDLSSEETECIRVVDNSGCFLNQTNATRVLTCLDDNPKTAADILCRCWGCNGNQLTNFIPRLNCTAAGGTPPLVPVNTTSAYVFPAPTPTGGR